MFAFVVESEPVVIDASADVVWDVLLDSDSFEAWNPFTTRIETDFEPGSPIHMHVVLGPLKLNLTEYVQEVEPPRRIAWGTDFVNRSLLTAKKTQFITPIDAGSCAYHTTDTMSGLLAPLVRLFFARLVLRGFDDTGRALKRRAEGVHTETTMDSLTSAKSPAEIPPHHPLNLR